MKKRLLSILMVTAMCATMVVGCGTADDTKDSSSSSKGKSDYLVGFANNSDTYNYCAKFRSYLKDATEAKGISITVTDAGGDTNVQNGQIDDFIVQNANVVSAISNDLDGSIPALEAAKDAGLPYVSFLTSVSGGDDYDGYIYVGSPNEDAGKAQGEYLCDAFPDGASILYFTGAPNDQQYVDRKKDLGMSTAEDSLLSYDKIDAIVCQNDDGALGVVEALKSAGKLDSIQVLGIDGSDDALQSIQDGEMTMTALQDAKAQAEAGADIFEKLKKGTDPADIEDVNIPFKIVTKDNVADYLSK